MKHLKYLWYVIRHKWYVFVECVKLGIPLQGILHDLSKFLPDEWIPYANFFYGNYPDEEAKDRIEIEFLKAWLRHIHRNPHHHQYWVLREDSGRVLPLDMPMKYRKEMLADWIGAGKAQGHGNDVHEWYAENRDKMFLHPDTRKWIEERL